MIQWKRYGNYRIEWKLRNHNNDGIPEPVSQGKPGALHEENSGSKEFTTECKGRIQEALRDAQKAEGAVSGSGSGTLWRSQPDKSEQEKSVIKNQPVMRVK